MIADVIVDVIVVGRGVVIVIVIVIALVQKGWRCV